MMVEEKTPNEPNGPAVPDSPIADDCREEQLSMDNNSDPTAFVAAALVKIRGLKVDVMLPMMGEKGELNGGYLAIRDRMTADDLAIVPRLHRLPLKTLSDPRVSITTRRSLERLVRAARTFANSDCEVVGLEDMQKRADELKAALEPFDLVARDE